MKGKRRRKTGPGRPPGKVISGRVHWVRIPENLYGYIQAEARKNEQSVAEFLRNHFREHYEGRATA